MTDEQLETLHNLIEALSHAAVGTVTYQTIVDHMGEEAIPDIQEALDDLAEATSNPDPALDISELI